MRKRAAALLLALALCLGPLPGGASAAERELPEWRFLFAAFKNVDADYHQNGEAKHTTYTMTQEELNFIREDARYLEDFLNQVGVMRAHVDVVEIDETITELADYKTSGGWLSVKESAPLLAKSKIDLDLYDHVFCIVSLNTTMGYYGLTGGTYENGAGHSSVHMKNRDNCVNSLPHAINRAGVYVHEFLHFTQELTQRYGTEFDLHGIEHKFYNTDHDGGKEYHTDIMLNRAVGDAGTGVHPAVWSHSPV